MTTLHQQRKAIVVCRTTVVRVTALFSALLFFMLLIEGCSKSKPFREPEPVLNAQGFRIVPSLGGGFYNSFTPVGEGKVFVVVTVDVPVKHIIPTDAEYRTFSANITENRDSLKKADGLKQPPVPSREQCRIYQADRFSLIVADGQGYHGDLVASSSLGGGDFFSSVLYESKLSSEKESAVAPVIETLNVAFAIDKKAAKPPMYLQLDRYPPVHVPEKK